MNLRQLAKGRHCTIRHPGCQGKETVVLAHAPSVTKALAIKSEDWWGAWACHNCHMLQDGISLAHISIMEKERLEAWLRGIHETQQHLITQGVLGYACGTSGQQCDEPASKPTIHGHGTG